MGGGEREKRTTAIGRGRHGATNLRWYNIKPSPRGVGASVGFGAPGLHFVVLHGRVDIQHPPSTTISTPLLQSPIIRPPVGWWDRERERQWCPSHTTQSTPSLPSPLEFSLLPCLVLGCSGLWLSCCSDGGGVGCFYSPSSCVLFFFSPFYSTTKNTEIEKTSKLLTNRQTNSSHSSFVFIQYEY